MHAFLIVGNNSAKIQEEIASRVLSWNISSWDVTRIAQEGTVGIELIRDFEHELSLSPRNSPAKVGILSGMERLTVEAQNALLKTLEEPPQDTYIIGTTNNPEALLPTIRSRMSVVKLTNVQELPDAAIQKLLAELMTATPGKQLTLLEPYSATRDDAKKFISVMLTSAREELICLNAKSPLSKQKLTQVIRNLLAASAQLSVNVNQKLVLDNVFLR